MHTPPAARTVEREEPHFPGARHGRRDRRVPRQERAIEGSVSTPRAVADNLRSRRGHGRRVQTDGDAIEHGRLTEVPVDAVRRQVRILVGRVLVRGVGVELLVHLDDDRVVARRQRRRNLPRALVRLTVRRRRRRHGVEIVDLPIIHGAHVTDGERAAEHVAVVVREHREVVARRVVRLGRRLELALHAVEVLRGTGHDVDAQVYLRRIHRAAEVGLSRRARLVKPHPGLEVVHHERGVGELAARVGPQGQRHPALAVGELRARAKVPHAGAVADPARRRQARHHDRISESVIGCLEPHGDLRPEVEVLERLPAGGAAVRVVTIGLERVGELGAPRRRDGTSHERD